jgi:phage-related protein
VEPRELKTTVTVLQELGLSYQETLEVMKRFTEDLRSTKSLWRDGDKSRLVKIGLTIIAIPEPTPISETLGGLILSLGLIQNKMKKSTLHIEDVYKTFQDVNRNLLRIRQELI